MLITAASGEGKHHHRQLCTGAEGGQKGQVHTTVLEKAQRGDDGVPTGLQCREEDQGQAQKSSVLQPQALVQENKVKQASPGQGPPGAWAAWPQRSGHVYSSSPSWPPQQHSTWEGQQSQLDLASPLTPSRLVMIKFPYPFVWKAPRESNSRKSSPWVLGLFPVKRKCSRGTGRATVLIT